MKSTYQSNPGPVSICKGRSALDMSAKKRTALSIAKRIKTLASSKRSTKPSCANPKNYDSSFRDPSYGKALLQNHSNFKKSAIPSRFMFFRNDGWNDYPEEVVGFLKSAFIAGMPIVECTLEGYDSLFDFLRMLQFDSVTGLQRSIAWMDTNGQCFFPKSVVNEETEYSTFPKVEIEIKINKVSENSPNSNEEHTGESLPIVPETPKFQSLAVVPPRKSDWANVGFLEEGGVGYTRIKSIFLSGFSKSKADNITVTSICKCSHLGPAGFGRWKAFQNQISLTKAARGNANLKLGWYGAMPDAVSSIISHGFIQPGRSSSSSGISYGIGLYLSPHHLSQLSASLSKADSNGEKHLILCRVILGNPETVPAGSSHQFHPSSQEFDCGVDDRLNPRWYIVWSTHMNQYVLPEYIVSFKYHDDKLKDASKTRTSSSTPPSVVSFNTLFSEMEKRLPSCSYKKLVLLHAQYKDKNISKEDFLRQMRQIAGDELLISTIQKIRGH